MKKESNATDEKNSKKKRRGIKPSIYFISMILVAFITFSATNFYQETFHSVSLPLDSSSAESSDHAGVTGNESLNAVYETILRNYIEEVDKDTLVEGALTGMVNAIDDPYSQYLNTEESSSLDETISASFEGIGAEVMSMNDQIVIVSPIKGSPAEEAGLLPNDVVRSVDGTSISGMTTTEAVALIRGEKGTSVQLEIQRGGQVFTIDIVRDTIPIETVTYELDEAHPEIGAIHVHSFSKPTYDEIVTAVTDLRKAGATKFVFDFRQNPGGLLDQALKISNMFVEDGSVLVQTQEKDTDPQPIFAKDKEFGKFQVTEPSVLLVDEGSASASEIVAGALKEAASIPLVGTTTFGKGTVQTIYPLNASSELKLTVAKWLTPLGNWIHEEGIKPDYEVKLPEYAFLTIIDSSADYHIGAVSDAVLNVEKMLEAIGYSVTADGYYDENTAEAVEIFQEEHDLQVTGEITDETAVVLVENLRKVIAENDTQYDKAIEVLNEMK